jgi:hypothetical protein
VGRVRRSEQESLPSIAGVGHPELIGVSLIFVGARGRVAVLNYWLIVGCIERFEVLTAADHDIRERQLSKV